MVEEVQVVGMGLARESELMVERWASSDQCWNQGVHVPLPQ